MADGINTPPVAHADYAFSPDRYGVAVNTRNVLQARAEWGDIIEEGFEMSESVCSTGVAMISGMDWFERFDVAKGIRTARRGGSRDWSRPDAWHRGYTLGLLEKYKTRQQAMREANALAS